MCETTTTKIQSTDAPFSFATMRLRREEPPPHSRELNHALSSVGGPAQLQLSRPMFSGHHISMQHRLRRKHPHLNSDTNAGMEFFWGRKTEKSPHLKNEKKRNENHESGVTVKRSFPYHHPMSTEAQKSNFHKRKSSFLQYELFDDFFSVLSVRKKGKMKN